MRRSILSAVILAAVALPSPGLAAPNAKPCAIERDQAAADAGQTSDAKPPVADATAADVAAAAGSPAPTGSTTGGSDAPVEGSEAWTSAHGSTAAVGDNGDCTLSIGQ